MGFNSAFKGLRQPSFESSEIHISQHGVTTPEDMKFQNVSMLQSLLR